MCRSLHRRRPCERRTMKIHTQDLAPDLWRDLEALFGPRGACGGCWCMWWRLEKGERWDDLKGAPAKARFRRLVASGKAHGAVAYHNGAPVGWISYERRRDLPRLDRAPSLACDDAERVWSIPCFFIAREYRRRGVATVLLRHALRALRARGAQIAEGYPVRPGRSGAEIPPLFAFTGTLSLFAHAGFTSVGARKSGKQRVRKALRRRPPAP